jgi:hypothetical protein
MSGLRAADLVFDPTLACSKVGAPGHRRPVGVAALVPCGAVCGAHPPVSFTPRESESDGQDLPLNRTMLSNHKLPYVGRFACDWPRLATTDPHAARGQSRPRPAKALGYCPGTLEPADPEPVPALPGVAPSSTVTLAIFQVDPTNFRSISRRTTSDWGVLILLFT